MYNAHKITDKVAAGKLAIGSHVGFDSPFVTEMIAGCGFDFIWIDGEHSAIDRKDIQNHLMACRAAGAAGIVRVPWNDPVIIKAILDMGADGIVVPMVCSLEEAKQAAAATHYPPDGIRGMGTRRAVNYGIWDKNAYVADTDKYILTIVQIEHIDVVKDLPEIAKLPGISGFVVGPNDFTMSMNTPERTYTVNDPEVQEQFDKIGQALAGTGSVTYAAAIPIIMGQNIGTCITAVLASIGTSRSAKRATIIHLMFNIIGTVLFTILCILFPLADLVASFTPDAPAAQIANMHTIFNIVTTLLLLPLGNQLASLAVRILPEQPEENRDEMHLEYLTPVQVSSKDGNLGASAIHIGQLQQELDRMLDMAQDNIETSFDAVLSRDSSLLTKAEKMESYLDFLNKEISKYISRLITYETNEQGSSIVSSYFTITGNIERIGDHAINICGYSKLLEERLIQFSAQAQEEICQMRDICLEALNALHQREAGDLLWLTDVSALEQRIDDMTDLFRKDQLERMKAGTCSDEACILYSELLTDFERIGDHVLNIAQEMSSIREHS